ncbi:ABC transporter ATP-binding protein [Pararhodobacter sp.]|uniref:ABC transporter ATP-binding protein n=1 Tax=Pararhodobacter sp. TaxID=2127056 RepID=UPI002FE2D223
MTDDSEGLQARHLMLNYGRRRVIEDVSLAVEPRHLTIILGPNGCGKSTLLRAFAGQIRPDAGAVLLAGRPLHHIGARALARQVGFLPQAPLAPEGMTVSALVRLGRHPHRGPLSAWSAADRAACDRALAATGMSGLAGAPLDALSGGQRQRAWIAMSLAQETPTLLLDEPTTYLDLAHQIDVLETLQAMTRQGRTVLAVLHDLHLAARYADRLILLHEGRLKAEGTPAEVLTAARVEDVFGLPVRILDDPETGRPLPIPRRRV